MRVYRITEHHGRKIREKMICNAEDQEEALRLSAGPPFRMPPEARTWPFIDDSLGGGTLIDPKDENHCLRADPRPELDLDDSTEESNGFQNQA